MHTTSRTTLLLTLATIMVAAGLIAGWGRVLAAPRGHGPIGAQISVSMLDDEGDPVSGATITVRDERDQLVHRTTTDGQGAATTNLGPAAGRYRVLAELPAAATDLVPDNDTDGQFTPSPRGNCPDWRLCVTFDQNAAGTTSAPGVHPRDASEATARFNVRDTAPEPRLAIAELDVTDEQPVPLAGGTVTIARLRRDGTTEDSQTKQFHTPSVLFERLAAGTYRVDWTPPRGYSRVTAQVHEVTVEKMTSRDLRAKRVTEGAHSWGDDRNASVVPIRVWIHDVTNGAPQPFSGGMLELFHVDEHGVEHREQAEATFGARFDRPGGAVVEYERIPDGYELVGAREDVADSSDPDVTFRVRRIRPRTGDDGQHSVEEHGGDRPVSPPSTEQTLDPEPRQTTVQPQDSREEPQQQPLEQPPARSEERRAGQGRAEDDLTDEEPTHDRSAYDQPAEPQPARPQPARPQPAETGGEPVERQLRERDEERWAEEGLTTMPEDVRRRAASDLELGR